MQVTTDLGLAEYLKRVLTQLQAWLERGEVKKLVLVITGVEKEEVLERSGREARSESAQKRGTQIMGSSNGWVGLYMALTCSSAIHLRRVWSGFCARVCHSWVFDVQTDEKAVAQK